MFGENEIIGEKTINIDSKNRIILPSFTGVEIKDKLIPQLNVDNNILFIYGIDVFNKKDEKFNEFLSKTKMSYEKIRKIQRLYYGKLSFMPEEVDSSKRIVIPSRAITKLELTDKVFVIGNGHHLEIYKSKGIYERVQEERKRRGR